MIPDLDIWHSASVLVQQHGQDAPIQAAMRTLALPKEVEHWSLTTLREKLVKIGAKVVRHGRYVAFQLNCHGFGCHLGNVGLASLQLS